LWERSCSDVIGWRLFATRHCDDPSVTKWQDCLYVVCISLRTRASTDGPKNLWWHIVHGPDKQRLGSLPPITIIIWSNIMQPDHQQAASVPLPTATVPRPPALVVGLSIPHSKGRHWACCNDIFHSFLRCSFSQLIYCFLFYKISQFIYLLLLQNFPMNESICSYNII
jgi:hypothetical protein